MVENQAQGDVSPLSHSEQRGQFLFYDIGNGYRYYLLKVAKRHLDLVADLASAEKDRVKRGCALMNECREEFFHPYR